MNFCKIFVFFHFLKEVGEILAFKYKQLIFLTLILLSIFGQISDSIHRIRFGFQKFKNLEHHREHQMGCTDG